jgi:hypothetical protein
MGFSRFTKPLDVQVVIAEYKNRIDRYKKFIEFSNKVGEILKNFDGKSYSKRIETAIKKALPEYQIYMEHVASQYYINIRGNGISYEDKIHIFIGYSDRIFKYDDYVNQYNRLESTIKSIEQHKNGIAKIPEMVERYNKLLSDVRQLTDDAEAYNMEYTFDLVCNGSR